MDSHDDPDSEWPMLLTISRWLVDSSPTVANMSSWPYTPPTQYPLDLIMLGAGVGAVLILVAVVILKRR